MKKSHVLLLAVAIWLVAFLVLVEDSMKTIVKIQLALQLIELVGVGFLIIRGVIGMIRHKQEYKKMWEEDTKKWRGTQNAKSSTKSNKNY